MNCIRNSILRHVRLRASGQMICFEEKRNVMSRMMCTSTSQNPDQILDRVIELVKKFDKIDDAKVNETTHFQKDLSLDSLDKVELVMAFEQEFSIEIPEEEADKLTCCADVAKYVASVAETKTSKNL